MSRNYEKPSFKKLLEKLQEESWQLELLISGFAIFGLFYAVEPVDNALIEALKGGETIFIRLLSSVKTFLIILIFNLILHVILRGLWIGALGLRYVSGEIDYEELNYSEKFTNYLKRTVGSFDDYIGKLENYCSVIFAVSFLLVFYVMATTIVVFVLNFIGNSIVGNESLPAWVAKGIGIPLMILTLLGTLLTFFDLVTVGLLKKKQLVSKIYFPFYRVFSVLTLSFLYKPLVYNFLDNKFGRRVSMSLIPFYILILIASSVFYQKSNFFTGYNKSNVVIANHKNYEDLKEDDYRLYKNFTIQSKVITDPFLKIYMPFYKSTEDMIFEFNPDLKPEKDKRGLRTTTNISFNSGSSKKDAKLEKITQDSLKLEYINTFNKIYFLKIDTTSFKTDFIIDKIKRDKFGFETYIGLNNLTEGKHILKVSKRINKDTIGTIMISEIPFWYYKD